MNEKELLDLLNIYCYFENDNEDGYRRQRRYIRSEGQIYENYELILNSPLTNINMEKINFKYNIDLFFKPEKDKTYFYTYSKRTIDIVCQVVKKLSNYNHYVDKNNKFNIYDFSINKKLFKCCFDNRFYNVLDLNIINHIIREIYYFRYKNYKFVIKYYNFVIKYYNINDCSYLLTLLNDYNEYKDWFYDENQYFVNIHTNFIIDELFKSIVKYVKPKIYIIKFNKKILLLFI